jgi:N-acetylmuramoyl-L-alanine amidase
VTRLGLRLVPVLVAAALVACGTDGVAPSPAATSSEASSNPTAAVTPAPTPLTGAVDPAPGSTSEVYAPNPAAIVVAIEAGHGGCLDWGVADPQGRGPEFSEKAITLAIARALADRLAADGVTPVLIREADEALAGDLYPPLGCEGEQFRDVNGDGLAGFGPDLPEGTRTRDELQARLDRANLVGADVLISLHVDSITDAAGNLLPIARTETFYTDETPWGVPHSERLATELQENVLRALASVAEYDRQDRGVNAHNLYIVAPPLFETTPERPDPARQPARGALMPTVLVEVGSISQPDEHELLLSDAGIAAAASGLRDGLIGYFAARELAARIALADAPIGQLPRAVAGDGPPFWAPPVADGVVRLRITNTGNQEWPAGMELIAGWESSDAPYLYLPPADLGVVGSPLPALEPGASVVLDVDLPPSPADGALAWISLRVGHEPIAELGSPALQLSNAAP